MKTDINIADETTMLLIKDIGSKIGLDSTELELYGEYKAKISLSVRDKYQKKAKTVLVTAMNPTPAGEGKTTVSIGLCDGLNSIDVKSIVTLREPSLGPVFGIKGGATGGGYSQILPMEDINLHFTGDIHAVTSAHNMLAAVLDNNYSQSNLLCMEPKGILWHRVVDINDRSLRDIVIGLGDKNGQIRQSRFEITASSEIMAILGLAKDIDDLKRRLGNIIVAVAHTGNPIYARELNVENSLAILLKDAIKPNLVQTLEHNPVIVHAGPFANIAHGTNSVIAIDIASRLCDIVVIEAGFGSDLGGEKFLDIVSRQDGMSPPDAIVIVATVRALRYHGHKPLKSIEEKDINAVKKGFANLEKHIENMKSFNRPVIVTLNKFSGDSEDEIKLIKKMVEELNTAFVINESWALGSKGAVDLAKHVKEAVSHEKKAVNYVYDLNDSIEDKIEKISKRIYGADSITMTRRIKKKISDFTQWGYGNLPVCIAKTQKSLSDESHLLGRPKGFDVEIKDLRVDAGAEFIVVYMGDIMTMPGLPKKPASEYMEIDNKGKIKVLY